MPALPPYIIEPIFEQFSCSESTLRRRRDEWIELGAMDTLERIVREAYDRIVGLELEEVAVDCCITKAPCGGEKAGRSPVDRGKRGIKRSVAVDVRGIPLGIVTAPARAATTRRCWQGHWTPLERWICCQRERVSAWIVATTRRPHPREAASWWPEGGDLAEG